MTSPKPDVSKHTGGHLFTVDQKYCSIYYRGVIAKETDKTFLIEDKNSRGKNFKVLKGNLYVVAPSDAEPATVLDAFETVRKSFQSKIDDLRAKLAKEQTRQFEASMAALHQAAGDTNPDEEEIGTATA